MGMDLKGFLGALADGKYQSVAGARRAVGKAKELSDKDKEKAHAAINEAFPEGEPAEKPAATDKRKPGRPRKDASAPAKPVATKPAVKVAKPAAKKPGRKPAAKNVPVACTIPEDLKLASFTIENVSKAAATLLQLQEKTPGLKLDQGAVDCADTLEAAVSVFRKFVVPPVQEEPEAEVQEEDAT